MSQHNIRENGRSSACACAYAWASIAGRRTSIAGRRTSLVERRRVDRWTWRRESLDVARESFDADRRLRVAHRTSPSGRALLRLRLSFRRRRSTTGRSTTPRSTPTIARSTPTITRTRRSTPTIARSTIQRPRTRARARFENRSTASMYQRAQARQMRRPHVIVMIDRPSTQSSSARERVTTSAANGTRSPRGELRRDERPSDLRSWILTRAERRKLVRGEVAGDV
jgi:hypothetical protein